MDLSQSSVRLIFVLKSRWEGGVRKLWKKVYLVLLTVPTRSLRHNYFLCSHFASLLCLDFLVPLGRLFASEVFDRNLSVIQSSLFQLGKTSEFEAIKKAAIVAQHQTNLELILGCIVFEGRSKALIKRIFWWVDESHFTHIQCNKFYTITKFWYSNGWMFIHRNLKQFVIVEVHRLI